MLAALHDIPAFLNEDGKVNELSLSTFIISARNDKTLNKWHKFLIEILKIKLHDIASMLSTRTK